MEIGEIRARSCVGGRTQAGEKQLKLHRSGANRGQLESRASSRTEGALVTDPELQQGEQPQTSKEHSLLHHMSKTFSFF